MGLFVCQKCGSLFGPQAYSHCEGASFGYAQIEPGEASPLEPLELDANDLLRQLLEAREELQSARTKLAALKLRSAPPKIDGVPTVPGWYWARSSWRGWMCVEVRAELNGGELGFYGWGYVEEAQPLDLLKDYHGPLTPPKETT